MRDTRREVLKASLYWEGAPGKGSPVQRGRGQRSRALEMEGVVFMGLCGGRV